MASANDPPDRRRRSSRRGDDLYPRTDGDDFAPDDRATFPADGPGTYAGAPGDDHESMVELNALLGNGTTYEGNLHFFGRVRIEGDFRGNIRGGEVLVVGHGARIEADIEVDVCIVTGGEVIGDIRARQAIELHAPAYVEGDLHAPNVFVDRGVQFDGKCKMAPLDDSDADFAAPPFDRRLVPVDRYRDEELDAADEAYDSRPSYESRDSRESAPSYPPESSRPSRRDPRSRRDTDHWPGTDQESHRERESRRSARGSTEGRAARERAARYEQAHRERPGPRRETDRSSRGAHPSRADDRSSRRGERPSRERFDRWTEEDTAEPETARKPAARTPGRMPVAKPVVKPPFQRLPPRPMPKPRDTNRGFPSERHPEPSDRDDSSAPHPTSRRGGRLRRRRKPSKDRN